MAGSEFLTEFQHHRQMAAQQCLGRVYLLPPVNAVDQCCDAVCPKTQKDFSHDATDITSLPADAYDMLTFYVFINNKLLPRAFDLELGQI